MGIDLGFDSCAEIVRLEPESVSDSSQPDGPNRTAIADRVDVLARDLRLFCQPLLAPSPRFQERTEDGGDVYATLHAT